MMQILRIDVEIYCAALLGGFKLVYIFSHGYVLPSHVFSVNVVVYQMVT
jgi:hypothetical protein